MGQCLVTGGAGFIGSHMTRFLLGQGQKVRILDDFSTGRRENLEEIKDQIEIVEGTICSEDDVKKALEGVELVFHLGAMPSVPTSVEQPVATNQANIYGTLNVLENARHQGVKRVVYAATSAVYGDDPTLPKQEDMPPQPISPYALQKLAGEYYCGVYYKLYQLETVAMRYFNVFGPRQNPRSQYAAVIPKFIDRMLANRPPLIYGDGEQTRDFIYVEDVVRANWLASQVEGEALGKAHNIAQGQQTDLNQLVEKLNGILGTSFTPEYTDPAKGDVKHSVADITRAKENLKFTPEISLEEGLKRTVEYFQSLK